MTPRALWKGHLKGPGIECGVGLYSALSSAEKVSFHIVNRKTGNRVERRFVDSETEAAVERDDQVRGYQLDDGNYVLVEPEVLTSLVPESDKTIAIKHFLSCDDVDKLYFDKPYYLAPADDADEEAFRTFGETLERTSTVAFAEAVLFRRNRALIVRVHEGVMLASTLNYDYEVRSARNAFRGLSEPDYDEELLDLAGHLIKSKMSRFDPADYRDRYNAALMELVRAKMEGRKLPKAKPEPERKVVDLREALRLSAKQSDARGKKSQSARQDQKGRLIMSLQAYNAKRRFDKTPEPQGEGGKSGGSSFVIQKHAARRLHYDFRLEMDGVLKSWAVTRGPSLDPEDKRLAVEVEDHPLAYGDFEGAIPKGQYGAGAVVLWDRGTWHPVGDPHRGLKKGHLEFTLEGEKLSGRWHLVRMKPRDGEKRKNWLLIKGEDEAARPDHGEALLEEMPLSVKSKKRIEDMAKAPDARWSGGKSISEPAPQEATAEPWPKGAKAARMPGFVEPQLASLKSTPPKGAAWLHEIKFDGYRMQARIDEGDLALLTRSGLDWTEKFGEDLSKALLALPAQTALIDGEIVVERANGVSDFSALQKDLSEERSDRFVYYAFDLLYLDGHDLRQTALKDRKARLEALLKGADPRLRYSAHFDEAGGLVLDHACRLSLEGVVSKRADGAYRSGRNGQWIKSKCSERQEFVIGGYAPSSTSRTAIGSLALGVYEDQKLRHVGRVGTGFTRDVAEMLFDRLQPLATGKSPFNNELDALARRQLVFVKPELVAEVEFRAWSGDGNLRHASFRGLREDKPAREIVQEGKVEAKTGKRPQAPQSQVKLTHPDRLYWPNDGVTKQGLVEYYADVWRLMAPYVIDRPLALVRCPDGIDGPHFLQKHGWRGMNKHIDEIVDPKDKGGKPALRILDFDGLVALTQSGCLEIHPWGTTTRTWEQPDMITMDLDPAEDVEWPAVIAAALALKERIEKDGLAAFVKTSGGKGLHVVIPLKPQARWPKVKAYAKGLATSLAKDDPSRYIAVATKAKRHGRIFIDYLRNGRGSTAVAAYSTRARPGAAISMPLDWSELTPDIGPAHFTVDNVRSRLENLASDPWADFFEAARPLP